MTQVFDDRPCVLGEGPLWHPERGQLFWFDIIGRKLLSRDGDTRLEWQFDEYVSAAGWIDRDTLLIASATGLNKFSLTDGTSALVHPLEADNPVTRSKSYPGEGCVVAGIDALLAAGRKRQADPTAVHAEDGAQSQFGLGVADPALAGDEGVVWHKG